MTNALTRGLGLGLALAMVLPAQQSDQDEMIARRDKKLAAEFLKRAAWLTDFDAAKEQAAEDDQLIFAYLTRSFAA